MPIPQQQQQQPAYGQYGQYGQPQAVTGNEMSKAALHDPFAALTGLPPPRSSPRPSPPKPGFGPY